MALVAAPFCEWSAFFNEDLGVIVSWAVIDGLDVDTVRIEVDRGGAGSPIGFGQIGEVGADDGRFVDTFGGPGDTYRLIGVASTGDTWTATVEFDAQTEVEPFCLVTGTIQDAQGQPAFNVLVRAISLPVEGFHPTPTRPVIDRDIETTTNADGFFSLSLLQGAVFRMEIPDANISFPTQIPEQGSVDFNDLETLLGDFIRK